MKTNKTNIILYLVLAVMGYFLFIKDYPSGEVKIIDNIIINDTTIIDTLTITHFKEVTSGVIREDTLLIGVDTIFMRDTLIIRDSIPVYIPISQKRYKGIGYDILAEGYKVELIEVNIFPEKHYIEKLVHKEITLPPKRISHGLNLGVGMMYGTKGLDFGVYVGYGLRIRL